MENNREDKPYQEGNEVPPQLRAETVAFALQSGVYNIATCFLEPYVNYKVQRHYAPEDLQHHKISGNYTQNLAGELTGDVIGASTLILSELLFPRFLHNTSRHVRKLLDPLYSSVSHRVLADQVGQSDYEQKVEQWKTFQERNLIRAGIIGTASIAGNIATQKFLYKNPSPSRLIFAGKIAGTALTTALELGVRFMYPMQMKKCDGWIADKLLRASGNKTETEEKWVERTQAAPKEDDISRSS